MNRWTVFWEARWWAELTRLKTERSGVIKTRAAILFTFQSRKDVLVTDSSQPGKSG
jgi:hypothetical protein